MADQLPTEPAGLLDDLRVMVANLAVERGAGADTVAGQNLHDPPDADPVAVIPHGPVAHVRDPGVLARDPLVEVAGHHIVESEELDIRIDPQRHPGVARPGQLGAAGDRHIHERTVTPRSHGETPATPPPPSCAVLPPPTGSATPRSPSTAVHRRRPAAGPPRGWDRVGGRNRPAPC